MARSAATQILKRHGATAFNTNAMIIDELGYAPMSRQARNALLQIINRFYEYRSPINHAKSGESGSLMGARYRLKAWTWRP